MKMVLKILCAPIVAILALFIWLATQLIKVSAVVMNFIAIALALGAVCILLDGRTGQGHRRTGSGLLDDPIRPASACYYPSGTGAEVQVLDSGYGVCLMDSLNSDQPGQNFI